MRPEKGTYPAYYENYIPLVNQEDLVIALTQDWKEVKQIAAGISKDKENYAYAEGKWTIKQLFVHLIDTERIFAYRSLRFARKDPQQPLPYEENDYAAHSEVENRTLADIMEEFEAVRKSSILMYKSFPQSVMLRSGKLAAGDATVVAIGFTICGHCIHHMNVLKERYL